MKENELISGIVIMNHKNRLQEGKVLQKIIERQADKFGIPVVVQTDHTDYYKKRETRWKGLVMNYMNCLQLKLPEGKYRIIIQDDVLLPPRALDNIVTILSYATDGHIIGLYNPTNSGYDEAQKKGCHVMSTRANIWPQCIAWPNDEIPHFVNWANSNVELGKEGEDWLMAVYSHYTGRRILVAIPSTVQHLGRNRSMFGIPGIISGRKRCSENYDPDFDFNSVDWEYEFSHPYVDNLTTTSGKGLREFKETEGDED